MDTVTGLCVKESTIKHCKLRTAHDANSKLYSIHKCPFSHDLRSSRLRKPTVTCSMVKELCDLGQCLSLAFKTK